MGEGLIKRSTAPAASAAAAVLASIDQELARSMSAALAEHHRLAFAQSFTYAVIRACWEACEPQASLSPPDAVELVGLSSDAAAAAARIGAAVAELEPPHAAYFLGS